MLSPSPKRSLETKNFHDYSLREYDLDFPNWNLTVASYCACHTHFSCGMSYLNHLIFNLKNLSEHWERERQKSMIYSARNEWRRMLVANYIIKFLMSTCELFKSLMRTPCSNWVCERERDKLKAIVRWWSSFMPAARMNWWVRCLCHFTFVCSSPWSNLTECSLPNEWLMMVMSGLIFGSKLHLHLIFVVSKTCNHGRFFPPKTFFCLKKLSCVDLQKTNISPNKNGRKIIDYRLTSNTSIVINI